MQEHPPAVLLFAPSGDAADLRVAGLGLLARQARQMARAGCTPLLLIDPPPLTEIPVGVEMLSAADLPARLAGLESVLVLAGGLLIDDRPVADLVAAQAPVLVVCEETADEAGCPRSVERLDARTHAAGLMRLPAALVARVAAGIGDWDLGSTLIRVASVEPGVVRRPLPAAGFWARPEDEAAVAEVEAGLLRGLAPLGADWPARWVVGPLATRMAGWLGARGGRPGQMLALELGLSVAALLCFGLGVLMAALPLAALASLAGALVQRLAALQDEPPRWPGRRVLLERWRGHGWLLAAGISFWGAAGWLALALVALVLLPWEAAAQLRAGFARLTGQPLEMAGDFERRLVLMAGGHLVLLVSWAAGAAVMGWFAGLALVVLHACVVAGLVQWRVLRGLEAWAGRRAAE